MEKDISKLDPKKYILIKGAKLHNLKNIDVAIPKNKLIVITGMSGSGKSTLAFDTLYAEGQRRYVESLSSYARQFLGKLNKPQVDYIHGIAPAIAIQQKVNSTNPRSTVGTSTEIYDYLKLLYARIGKTYSPITGELVQKDSVTDVIDFMKTYPAESKFILGIDLIIPEERTFVEHLSILQQQGFTRLSIDGNQVKIEDLISFNFDPQPDNKVSLLIDRISIPQEAEDSFFHRLADSIETAFFEGKGNIKLLHVDEKVIKNFSNKFEADGMIFNEPNTHFFSFNNPYGACPTCEGYGKIIGIDEDLVIPNKSLSIYEDAIAAWKGDKMSEWKNFFLKAATKVDFPIHKPYYELSEDQKDFLWRGNSSWEGLDGFFKMVEQNTYKIQYRVMLSRYRGKTICPTCKGRRLRLETNYVKINDKAISELVDLPLNELNEFFQSIVFSDFDRQVANRIIYEIGSRLQFLLDVGLDYLSLNRASNTLSGGESQRINLATSLGSSLVGSMYILDEPSIGLHSKDTERFVTILHRLRDLGNTVIVVEHDEDIMKAADYIIDIGPEAGTNGGEVVFQGTYEELLKADTLTGKYLNQKLEIEIPNKRIKPKNFLKIIGARENNLKNIDVKFPLNMLTVITGVSGSGKSTLMKDILTPALERHFEIYGNRIGESDGLIGDLAQLKGIELIDQNPIGKSSRSNPVTYVKAYDDIRNLFAVQKASKLNGFQAKHFSFNVDGGRCDACKGEGTITIEMQFMADVDLVCEECNGDRFKKSVLEIKYQDLSISDVLNLTIDEAIEFFNTHAQKKIVDKLKPLQDVGLGYVKLGQSSSTLSGGEAQRVKLAYFLTKGETADKTLFIFDEPSTGLHFHDIKKLIKALRALIDLGHSVFVIEHNMDIIKVADWIIDLGPEGGKHGGKLVAEGTPEDIIKIKESFTGQFLKEKLI
ncbi:excinuclease ABC subunit UvrA [Faecalibacter rhinopitheci]|uniref:UvrABC system protein A n=1 Tax=Faecalibacter rhinopitheci TaxID=2779678 RepID=A0A8J7K392_9FLAO|nr:excinuclease ABC subunit UvrA [Faecalibacter rhinopitheci]MBF0595879.1 excinuclease ABC subunit UvrA [Faecalibacter rhinopitheci]